MQENLITWNLANWVTVILMASIGYFLIGFATSAIKARQGGEE